MNIINMAAGWKYLGTSISHCMGMTFADAEFRKPNGDKIIVSLMPKFGCKDVSKEEVQKAYNRIFHGS